MERYFYTSVTRASNLRMIDFEFEQLDREKWETGDFVGCVVNSKPSPLARVELSTGRTIEVMEGSIIIGAFGKRYATLETVGDWRDIGQDLQMDTLGTGGVIGKMTSISPFMPPVISLEYLGHICSQESKVNMSDFIPDVPKQEFSVPTILVIGTSMSAGKTTTARIMIQQLKNAGYDVVGAKLTGSGRFRDILSMRDAGADHIFDFVDVGIPTTVVPPDEFRWRLDLLLSLIASVNADVAVLEIGSSPLEPYNGTIAIQAIEEHIRFTILCASDPYSAVGVISAYGKVPDLIAGITTNTQAGIELVDSLTGIPALNLLDRESLWKARDLLNAALKIEQ